MKYKALWVAFVLSCLITSHLSFSQTVEASENGGCVYDTLTEKGILEGVQYTGSERGITRAEFADLMVRSYEKILSIPIKMPSKSPFKDTQDPVCLKAYSIGTLKAQEDRKFNPEAILTREELCYGLHMLLYKLSPSHSDYRMGMRFSDVSQSDITMRKAVEVMVYLQYVNPIDDYKFGFTNQVSVKEVLCVLNEFMGSYRSIAGLMTESDFKTIEPGGKGTAVLALNEWLTAYEKECGDATVEYKTGVFTKEKFEALKRFQKDKGLPITGKLDPLTMKWLPYKYRWSYKHEVVEITNEPLKHEINKKLQRSEETVVWTTDLFGIYSLEIPKGDEAFLAFLQIEPLKHINGISINAVSERLLERLRDYENTINLSFTNCTITNLYFSKNMAKLNLIEFVDSEVKNINTLNNSKYLCLQFIDGVLDITDIEALSELRYLFIRNTKIVGGTNPIDFPKLEGLRLYGVHVANKPLFNSLPKLNELILVQTPISILPSIESQKALKVIRLSNVTVKEAENLLTYYKENPVNNLELSMSISNFFSQKIKPNFWTSSWKGQRIKVDIIGDEKNYYEIYNTDAMTFVPEYKFINEALQTVYPRENMTTQEKLNSVYDYVIRQVDYDYGFLDIIEGKDGKAYNPLGQKVDVLGSLQGRFTICEGYANIMTFLLQQGGVNMEKVTGSIKGSGERHAWNRLLIEGEYYHFDVTWDDNPNLNWQYFMVKEQDMLKEREMD